MNHLFLKSALIFCIVTCATLTGEAAPVLSSNNYTTRVDCVDSHRNIVASNAEFHLWISGGTDLCISVKPYPGEDGGLLYFFNKRNSTVYYDSMTTGAINLFSYTVDRTLVNQLILDRRQNVMHFCQANNNPGGTIKPNDFVTMPYYVSLTEQQAKDIQVFLVEHHEYFKRVNPNN